MQDLGTVSQLQQRHTNPMPPPVTGTIPRGLSAYTQHGRPSQGQQNTTTERLSLRPLPQGTPARSSSMVQMTATQQQPTGTNIRAPPVSSGAFRNMQAPQFSSAPAHVRNPNASAGFATGGNLPQQGWGGGTQQQQQGQRFSTHAHDQLSQPSGASQVEGSHSVRRAETFNAPPVFSTTSQQQRAPTHTMRDAGPYPSSVMQQSAYPHQAASTRASHEYGYQPSAPDQFAAGRDTRSSVIGPSRLHPTQTQQHHAPSHMHQLEGPALGQMHPGNVRPGQQSFFDNQGCAPSQPTTNADRYRTACL